MGKKKDEDAGPPWNCKHPVCPKKNIPGSAETCPLCGTAKPNEDDTPPPSAGSKSKLPLPIIIGAGGGGFVLLVVCVVCCRRRRTRRRRKSLTSDDIYKKSKLRQFLRCLNLMMEVRDSA